MGAYSFNSLVYHEGHNIVYVTYGRPNGEPVNVAVECETCNTVLLDFDREEELPVNLNN